MIYKNGPIILFSAVGLGKKSMSGCEDMQVILTNRAKPFNQMDLHPRTSKNSSTQLIFVFFPEACFSIDKLLSKETKHRNSTQAQTLSLSRHLPPSLEVSGSPWRRFQGPLAQTFQGGLPQRSAPVASDLALPGCLFLSAIFGV